MSRRTGQKGGVFQKDPVKRNERTEWNPDAVAYGQYWIDTLTGRKHRSVQLGKFATRSRAERKLFEHIEEAGVNDAATFETHKPSAPGVTFRERSLTWIRSLRTRKRRPIKQATIDNWQFALDKWVLPHIGDMPLADVSNAALKTLIDKMVDAGLSAKSIVNYTLPVKMVVASAVDSDGEQIYRREWNHDFVEMPIVKSERQHKPAFTKELVEKTLKAAWERAKRRYFAFFALLAGSGLRVGEALALRTDSFSRDCRVIHVTRSMYRRKEQAPKSESSIRDVDIPDSLAAVMRDYIKDKSGYLFVNRYGNPWPQRNLLRTLHEFAGEPIGFHAFRRFRCSVLESADVPSTLQDIWLGHAPKSIRERSYSQLRKDVVKRQQWCQRVGLGFELNYNELRDSLPSGFQMAEKASNDAAFSVTRP